MYIRQDRNSSLMAHLLNVQHFLNRKYKTIPKTETGYQNAIRKSKKE